MFQRPLQRMSVGVAGVLALSCAAAAAEPDVPREPAATSAGVDEPAGPQPAAVYIPQALAAAQTPARSSIMDVPLSQALQAKDAAERIDANGMPLGEPVLGPSPTPTPHELRERDARDRADALRAAKILAGVALAFGVASAPLYANEPRRGARRLAVVTGVAASLATAAAFAMQTTTWSPEFGLAVAASSLALGAGLLFLALLGLAGWRWVSAGFRIDRAVRSPATPITRTGEP